MQVVDSLLIKKYQPVTFEDYIGHNEFTKNLHNIIKTNPKELPSYTFYGSAGVGKSTLVDIIINELGKFHGFDEQDYIKVNGSGSGVNVVRDVIRPFIRTRARNRNLPKIIWIEEGDGLSSDAQRALKAELDIGLNNCVIYITTNKAAKLDLAITNRCKIVYMDVPNRDEILNKMRKIVKDEKLNLSDEDIITLINVNYPSIRGMIIDLDNYKLFGKTDFITTNKLTSDIYKYLLSGELNLAFDIAKKRDIDSRAILHLLSEKIINDENLTINEKVNYIHVICESDYKMVIGTLPELVFRDTIGQLFKV